MTTAKRPREARHRRITTGTGMSIIRITRCATALASLLWISPASASTPSSSSMTVPTSAGATATDHWTGTAPAGAGGAASQCLGAPLLEDDHVIHLTVQPYTYSYFTATFNFEVSWGDTAQDLVLTVLDSSGNVVGTSDGSDPHEQVIA